jgi:hypothetical protein
MRTSRHLQAGGARSVATHDSRDDGRRDETLVECDGDAVQMCPWGAHRVLRQPIGGAREEGGG